jgi:hypothetical protein
MFVRLYLRLADCQHKTLLRRYSTLESLVTASELEYTRCTKCHMVWPQPLAQSIDDWKREMLRDDNSSCEAPALNAPPRLAEE